MPLHPCSEEQQKCIDALMGGSNVVVRAQAGAGKSTTFLHAAKAWIAARPDAAKVVILCFNVNLRAASEARVAELGLEEKVHCLTVHSLASRIHGVGIGDTLTLLKHLKNPGTCPDAYDLCLIDEAQDLSGTMVAVINQLQQLRDDAMRYVVVGDRRQAIYDFARETEPEALSKPDKVLRPNGAPWVTCELNESYRLTPAIASFLNAHYRHPSDTPVVGVNVRARQIAPEYVHGDAARGDLVTLITEQLAEYAPQDIMVLAPSVRSPDYRCRHAAHTLSEQQGIALHTTHRRLVEVNPELLAGKLVISTYHQSKGDERKCVIVLGSDARLHARRGFPLKDGVAVVDNALHVALTRASEKLIVFVAHDQMPYPSVCQPALTMLCTLRDLTPPVPKPTPPCAPELKSIRRDVKWLIEFASEESIQVLGDLTLRDDVVRLGPPTDVRPEPIARMQDGHVEEVAGYFPAAAIGAVHRARIFETTNDAGLRSKLEADVRRELRGDQAVERLPPLYRRFCEEVIVNGRAPDGPRGWLTASVLHETLSQHRFKHVLRQVTDYRWVDQAASEFFSKCVDNLLKVVRTHNFHQSDFFIGIKRKDELTKTLVLQEILYMTVENDEHVTPWILSFDVVPSEANLLEAVLAMWMLQNVTCAVVYCMPSNTLHRVRVANVNSVDDFVTRLLVAKRRTELSAVAATDADAQALLQKYAC